MATMDVETMKKHIKDVQSASASNNVKEAVAILQLLKPVKATEDLLRQTKAGVAISKLRTNPSKEIADLCKEIVTKWKGEVEENKKKKAAIPNTTTSASTSTQQNLVKKPAAPPPSNIATNIKSNSTPSAPSPAPNGASTPTSSVPLSIKPERKGSLTPSVAAPSPTSSNDPRSAKRDGIDLAPLKNATRDKCIEMAYDAMVFDSGAPAKQIFERALHVERCVFDEFHDTSNAYRTKMRKLILNLKDKSNPALRAAVVSGDLAVERFCKMSSQEMASEERKQTNELLNAENLHNSLGAAEQEAETDAFKCGRCKQRKTRYRQAQTRSADEPMTTFVTCVNCGNRWKFS